MLVMTILIVAPFTPRPMALVEWLVMQIVGILTHSPLLGLISHAMDPLMKCCFRWKRLAAYSSLLHH